MNKNMYNKSIGRNIYTLFYYKGEREYEKNLQLQKDS